MLHKCANPPCPNLFRKMHQGRLFQLPASSLWRGIRSRRSGLRVEYFWLCDQCSTNLTLTYDPAAGIIAVPARTLPEENLSKVSPPAAAAAFSRIGELQWSI